MDAFQLPAKPIDYSYDPATGEFRGATPSDIDMAALMQHNELRYLSPAHSTRIAPPSVPSGSAAVWTGTEWTLIEDRRGEIWYRGAVPVQIMTLGPPPTDLAREPVVPEPAPIDKIAVRRAELLAKLNEVTSIGHSFTLLKQPVPAHVLADHAAVVDELKTLSEDK